MKLVRLVLCLLIPLMVACEGNDYNDSGNISQGNNQETIVSDDKDKIAIQGGYDPNKDYEPPGP